MIIIQIFGLFLQATFIFDVNLYQNMEKKDEEHEEQGMNEALTEARPSESAELKNRVHG